ERQPQDPGTRRAAAPEGSGAPAGDRTEPPAGRDLRAARGTSQRAAAAARPVDQREPRSAGSGDAPDGDAELPGAGSRAGGRAALRAAALAGPAADRRGRGAPRTRGDRFSLP